MHKGTQHSEAPCSEALAIDNDKFIKSPSEQHSSISATKIPWRSMFFLAAITTLVASLTALIGAVYHVGIVSEPASFVHDVFLVLFSVVMVVIELPYQAWHWQDCISEFVDRFLQFLTRFTGRGFWYLFLGTMVWVSCYVEGANYLQYVVGIVATSYLCLLGLASVAYGVRLTYRLHKVKEQVLQQGGTSQDYFPPDLKPMCKEYWRTLFEQHDANPVTDLELDFTINAISERFYSKDTVTSEEFDEWLTSPKFLFLV